MSRLFGTDGIRGIANEYPITPEMGFKLGRAVVGFSRQKGVSTGIVTGRDTRASGEILDDAIVSGVLSAGGDAYRVGILPTPGVAYLTKKLGAGAGIVLSASHNPQEYNGFKLFTHDGYKLSEDDEGKIESLILDEPSSQQDGEQGHVKVLDDAWERYVDFLEKSAPDGFRLQDLKIVLDCANGATFRVAPALFERLGQGIETMFAKPDGRNINQDCGSQHTGELSRRVKETGADVGLAFDGDGDRLIAVDEKGDVLSGDQILTICAKILKERGELKNNIVVSTVMSNMGLRTSLKAFGVEHCSTRVGDRHVMEEMRRLDSSLGGEESGHIIFRDRHTTGDGIIAAIQFLYAVKRLGQPLSELSAMMTAYPQTLINVPVREKPDIKDVPDLVGIIRDTEEALGEEGRVLVRYSGTEPLCRIMVEGRSQADIEKHARRIADVIAERLNPNVS